MQEVWVLMNEQSCRGGVISAVFLTRDEAIAALREQHEPYANVQQCPIGVRGLNNRYELEVILRSELDEKPA
jgi:hypothetical protein